MNTKKDELKVKVQEKGNEKYTAVGPFRWIYSGTLKNIPSAPEFNAVKYMSLRFTKFFFCIKQLSQT